MQRLCPFGCFCPGMPIAPRVEEPGRWAVTTVQWGPRKRLQLQYQCTWAQGRVRHRSQEEGAKFWAIEGVQSQGIATWHVRVLERAARRELHEQAQQGYTTG